MKIQVYFFLGSKKSNGEISAGKIQIKYNYKNEKKQEPFFFAMWWIIYHCFRNLNFCFLFQSFCKYILSSFKRSNDLISRVFLLKSRLETIEYGDFFFKNLTKERKFFKKKKYACFNSLQLVPVFKKKHLGEETEPGNKLIIKRGKLFLINFRIQIKKKTNFFLKLFSICISNKKKNIKNLEEFLNLTRFKEVNFFSENFSNVKGATSLITSQRFMYGQKILVFFLKLGFAKINCTWKTRDLSGKKKKEIVKKSLFYRKNDPVFIELSKIKFLRFGKKNAKKFLKKKILNLEILPSKNKIPLKVSQKIYKEPDLFRSGFSFCKFVKHEKRASTFSRKTRFTIKKEGPQESTTESKIKKKTNKSTEKNITKTFEVISKESQDFFHEQIGTLYISQFEKIFREEQLDIWLNSFLVFCFESNSGFLEMIPNSKSLHIINQKKNREKNASTESFYRREKEPNFEKKTQSLIESFAGYSLICFILQLKDRHNGNILLNKGNRIIHIDFGFIFDFSPGNLKFEADSFKMSRQFLSWVGGKDSELFENLREMFTRGFFSIRKNLGKLLTLARILIKEKKEDSRNKYKLQKFQRRFKISSRDSHIIKYCLGLFKESLESWKTLQYDRYQQIASGIE